MPSYVSEVADSEFSIFDDTVIQFLSLLTITTYSVQLYRQKMMYCDKQNYDVSCIHFPAALRLDKFLLLSAPKTIKCFQG